MIEKHKTITTGSKMLCKPHSDTQILAATIIIKLGLER